MALSAEDRARFAAVRDARDAFEAETKCSLHDFVNAFLFEDAQQHGESLDITGQTERLYACLAKTNASPLLNDNAELLLRFALKHRMRALLIEQIADDL